jgi:hypothetical protein
MSIIRPLCLLLTLVGALAAAAQEPQADPKARALLREAYERRYRWDAAFPGFAGKILVAHSGMERSGTIHVTAEGNVELALTDADATRTGIRSATKWAQEAVRTWITPLQPSSFARGDGKHPVTFGKLDYHPAGRSILLHDERHTSYRVRDGQLWQIEREESARGENPGQVLLEFLDFARTEEGLMLPRTITITRFEGGGGRLRQSTTLADTYQRLGNYYVPYMRREVVATDGGTETHWLRLTDLKFLQ